MLLASVKGEIRDDPGRQAGVGRRPLPPPRRAEETKAEPEAGDDTQTENTVTETADVGPAAKASGGSSLFDTPAATSPRPSPSPRRSPPRSPRPVARCSTSAATSRTSRRANRKPEAEPEPDEADAGLRWLAVRHRRRRARSQERTGTRAASPRPRPSPSRRGRASRRSRRRREPSDLGSGGSLFDIERRRARQPRASRSPSRAEPDEPSRSRNPQAEPSRDPEPRQPGRARSQIPQGGSLFDIAAPERRAGADEREPEPERRPSPSRGPGRRGRAATPT